MSYNIVFAVEMNTLKNIGEDKSRKKRQSPNDDSKQLLQKVEVDMGQLQQAFDGNSNLEVRSDSHISDNNGKACPEVFI